MAEDVDIIRECLDRIQAKYDRRGKAELFDDTTRTEFLRAFALVPLPLLPCVVDEVLLNPPTDDRGREINWLPDPSDILRVARKMTTQGGMTPSDVVTEIMDKIRQYGIYGAQDEECKNWRNPGAPPLSPLAEQAVKAMGGWGTLCEMEAPDGVVNGLLLKHAQNFVEREQQRLLIATRNPNVLPAERDCAPRLPSAPFALLNSVGKEFPK